jgi:hypothetical protein
MLAFVDHSFTYTFANFDDFLLGTRVIFKVGVRLAASVVVLGERNIWVILYTLTKKLGQKVHLSSYHTL